MSDEIPAAQGVDTNLPNPSAGAPEGQVAGQVPAGVQSRINELTAEKHAMREQMQAQQAQMNELLAQVMSLSQAQVQQQAQRQAPPDPFAQLDPEERARMQGILDAVTSPLKQEVQSLRNLVRETKLAQEVAQYGDPELAQGSAGVLNNWSQRGLTNIVTERDAVVYAAGLKYLKQLEMAKAGQNAQRAFNQAAGQGGTFTANAPPPPVQHQAQRPVIPDDLTSRSPQQIAAFLEAGDFDLPL